MVTARDHHQVTAYRKRAYALLLLYTCCLRIDSLLLHARVEDLGYDKAHRVLHLEKTKGGGRNKKPIPPVTWDALQEYLDGRETGWLFCTASGGQLDEPAVWRLCASLAKRAGLPMRGPHGTKGDAVTHALAKKDARPDKVQRWADHTDQRTCGANPSPIQGRSTYPSDVPSHVKRRFSMSVNAHDNPVAPQSQQPPRTSAAPPARGQRAWLWARRLLWPACILGGLVVGMTGHDTLGVALIAAAPAGSSLLAWRSYNRR
ncbi:tyrosine-type recombinase/integrase [Streptomyces sp. NPDC058000]|uniref:tyrosine-type recombinase/integrase n=1 Tax=Streptomyces sp. NPDC058000 TaxID=3346299 RepID=UPI0036E16D83